MTRREKTLSAAVAAAGLLWGADKGFTSYQTALKNSENAKFNAEQALSDAELEEYKGEKARKQLKQWLQRSLPADRQVAESVYRDWLRQLLKDSSLEIQQLTDDKSAGFSRGQFTPLTFDIEAKGSLENVTKFLFNFYHAPHLHRISRSNFSPTEDRKVITMTATIDALILEGCPREDELADDSAAPKAERELADVQKSIVSRNIFLPYTPKSNDAQNANKDWDQNAAKEVLVSGVLGGGDGWLLSLRFNKEDNKVKYFRQGDDVEIGSMKLKLLRLDRRTVVFEGKDGVREVRFGQTLDQAKKIADAEKAEVDAASAAVDDAADEEGASS